MTADKDSKEGWGRPTTSWKDHYFVGGTSLCGKWAFYFGKLDTRSFDSPDDCTACRKALKRRFERHPVLLKGGAP